MVSNEIVNVLIKSKKDLDAAIDQLGNNKKKEIQNAIHNLNKRINGNYPIAYEHMKRSIDGKGNVKHAIGSKISDAILNSKELKHYISTNVKASQCIAGQKLIFRANRDLTRTIQEVRFSGDIEISGKSANVNLIISDTYDFRFDLIPKTKTIRGWALRYAGNAAWAAQNLKLMKSYKITILVSGELNIH